MTRKFSLAYLTIPEPIRLIRLELLPRQDMTLSA